MGHSQGMDETNEISTKISVGGKAMNNTELKNKVQQWFIDRNLHEANPVK